MKIYNVKAKPIIITFITIVFIIIILVALYSSFVCSDDIVMTNENYTTVLKECHDDPYEYVNKKISATRIYFSS